MTGEYDETPGDPAAAIIPFAAVFALPVVLMLISMSDDKAEAGTVTLAPEILTLPPDEPIVSDPDDAGGDGGGGGGPGGGPGGPGGGDGGLGGGADSSACI